MIEIGREGYLERIVPFVDKPVIKVITGMRRVGKSCFFKQIAKILVEERDINPENIISINMEDLNFEFIKTYKELNNYIEEKGKKSGKKYLFIDEIQEIESWEKAILSLFAKDEYDIFITGSNAHLLSSELSTLLSGRYIEFLILPLNLKEFGGFSENQQKPAEELF